MKKLKLMAIFCMALISTISGAKSEEMLVFSYNKPYEYELINGSYKVSAIIEGEDFSEINFNGETLPIQKLEGDRFEIMLPLIGEPGYLQIKSGAGKDIRTQHFEPLIPADWDYFGEGKIHVVSSSHQDIAWMDTPDVCRHERVHDIVVPALDLIEKEPKFKFEMEQTLNLIEAFEDSPQNKQRYIDTYKSGNFEWGATFTQPYEGLESGEQLARQSYFGRRWIKKNLPGMDANVAYNIDVPGRSLQVPQLFKKSGIDYLFISRMKEGFYNWYSPDGTSIFTYSPGNYGWSLLVYKYLEEDAVTAMHKLHKVVKNWNEYYRERNLPPHYAVVISTDAGGPKYYKEVIEGWNEIVKNSELNIPTIQHSTATDFLHSIDVPGVKIDSISGERPNLWLYIHGAAHYQAIKAKKEAAVNLPAAEIFNTISSQLNGDFSNYPQKEIDEGWFSAIYPDHGWGGKNGEITDSIFRASLERGNEIGKELLNSSLNSIADKIDLKEEQNIIVFNDLSWDREGYASIDISHLQGNEWIVQNSLEEQIPTQLINTEEKKELIFNVKDVPSIGYKTFTIKKGERKNIGIKVGANYCENKFYQVQLGKGGITNLFDKQLQKEIFNTTRMPGGDLLHVGYRGMGAGEFVTVSPLHYRDIEKIHKKENSWRLVESGAVYSKYQSEYQLKKFKVKQIITVYHQKKQIDIEYDIPDWPGEHNRQIRVLFPLNMNEDAQISYDVPMGMLHVGMDELKISPRGWAWEGTYRQMPEEIRPREIQNFMTANGDGFGFTMSTNVVTADWVDPNRESVDYPVISSVLLSSHKSCHGEGNWYHQKGSHKFKFSITSHEEGWKNGYHFGVAGNHPFKTILRENKQNGELPSIKSFAQTSDPFSIITTIKKAEDDNDIVFRIMETEGVDKEIKITFDQEIEEISKTDLIEENPLKLNQEGKTLELKLGKNSVETYKFN